MKKLIGIMLLVLCLTTPMVAGTAMAADEADKGWAVDFSAAYMSKYIWRGIMQVDDPTLQPSLNIAKNGFTFNVWGNWDLTDKNGRKNKFSEIDLTAEYAISLGDFSVPVGVIHYLFPNTSFEPTTELYAGVSYSWIVTPSVKVYKDIDESHGFYVLGALSYEYELPSLAKEMAWKVAASISGAWGDKENNKFYWGGLEEDAFTDSLLTIGVPIKIMDWINITPAFYQAWLLDSKIKDAAGYDSKSYFGLTLTLNF
ncbi:MAG: TorF family putative porin [Pseudomonadota bacterium]